MTRRSGRRRFGGRCARPALNLRVRAVDDPRQGAGRRRLWCVVGTANFDNRSFGLNDEVNLAVRDGARGAAAGGLRPGTLRAAIASISKVGKSDR